MYICVCVQDLPIAPLNNITAEKLEKKSTDYSEKAAKIGDKSMTVC